MKSSVIFNNIKINDLYGRVYNRNTNLLKKSERPHGNYTCADVLDFYITSNALSFLRDLALKLYQSPGFMLNARCIIEGLAVKHFCLNLDNQTRVDLLEKQVPILEHKCYKPFDDIAELILIPEKLENDYKEAVEYYKQALSGDFSPSEIRDIIGSQIPFICCPRTNFRKIVGEQLGEDYAALYGLLSQILHPSTNDTYRNGDLLGMPMPVLKLIEDEYSSFTRNGHDLDEHFRLSLSSPVSERLGTLVYDESAALIEIADTISKLFGPNYISDTLQTSYLLLKEMMVDTLMGLREQTKAKWKLFIDLLAVFYEFDIKTPASDKAMLLLCKHAEIQFKRNIGKEYDLNEAYQTYISMYPNGVAKSEFEASFLSMTGYLIDEDGKVPSLTKIVKNFSALFDDSEADISYGEAFFLNYLESQLLSHANGYMWFANSGAWSDVNNILFGSDIILIQLLTIMLQRYKEADAEERLKRYKPITNKIRNGIKKISEASVEKIKLLNIPGQKLN